MNTPCRLKTIAAYHQLMQLPQPAHPLLSIIDFKSIKRLSDDQPSTYTHDFYSIALKRNFNGKIKYGQQAYDFDEGIMLFMAPGQVFSIEVEEELQHTGWLLLLHPDYLWSSPLAKTIRQYEYFSYATREALHLSQQEEVQVTTLMQNIAQEYQASLDTFSQKLILHQLELLLTYAERFYHRQFITRQVTNHTILNRLEVLLMDYFNGTNLAEKGPPTVASVADALHVSPNYLSALLKTLTGLSTQQHIQNKLIEKAKDKLSTTDHSVSEIAYELGFEHSQSFNKLFKSKTRLSPLEFRRSFL
ncbi:helix-turn-helix domain-containing protein [Siphonobacter sp.]|uniref:helix-turn-helix domain-containing protein n=1 Tax=Siphonobacter sp. TaxID=1869184 RepID=UPI003B3B43EF